MPTGVSGPPAVMSMRPDRLLTPPSVCPSVELMTNAPVVFIVPTPDSAIEPEAPVAVRLTAPPPSMVMGPVILIVPPLVTERSPPPLLIPASVKAPLLVSATSPLVVLTALTLPTAFAPFSVCPVTELVVSVPEVLSRPPPDSVMATVPTRLIAPPPAAATVPVMPIGPALLTVMLPPPALLIAASVSAPVFANAMLPLAALVALKLPIALAPFSVCPPLELVVNVPGRTSGADCVSVPPADSDALPVAVIPVVTVGSSKPAAILRLVALENTKLPLLALPCRLTTLFPSGPPASDTLPPCA